MQNTWEGHITDTGICYCWMINVCRGLSDPKNICLILLHCFKSPSPITRCRSWYWETKKDKIVWHNHKQWQAKVIIEAWNWQKCIYRCNLQLIKLHIITKSLRFWRFCTFIRFYKCRRNVFSIVVICGCTG